MVDCFSKEKRSEIMSNIRSTGTSVEKLFFSTVGSRLHALGYRYRKNYKKLLGKPDMAFVSRKVAVFVDGEFWHGRHYEEWRNRLPKDYWRDKIAGNIKRDKKINRKLRSMNWTVLRFWEADVKKNPERCLKKILRFLKEKNHEERQ